MFRTFFHFIFIRISLIGDPIVKNQSCLNGIFVRCLMLNFRILHFDFGLNGQKVSGIIFRNSKDYYL